MRAPIIVPLDGSPFGEQAIPTALGMARRSGAPVELVLVQEPIVVPESIRLTLMRDADRRLELRDAGVLYLEMVATRAREVAGVEIVETMLEGPVVEALATHIAAREPSHVVMSTHGRGGFSRAWLGSVADALVRRIAVPVLLVRPRDTVVEREGATRLEVPPAFTRIAVPLDGSAEAEDAIAEALRIAGDRRVELTLLQVLPPPVTYLRPSFTADVAAGLLADLELDAGRYLDRLASVIARPNLTVRTRVFVDHNAARGILAFAGSGSIDLLVMMTHARRGLTRVVLGSVADKVVRGATIPVMLVRPAIDSTIEMAASLAGSWDTALPLPPL